MGHLGSGAQRCRLRVPAGCGLDGGRRYRLSLLWSCGTRVSTVVLLGAPTSLAHPPAAILRYGLLGACCRRQCGQPAGTLCLRALVQDTFVANQP
eukprot:10648000-Alexandrium_andersonii.AAC.1